MSRSRKYVGRFQREEQKYRRGLIENEWLPKDLRDITAVVAGEFNAETDELREAADRLEFGFPRNVKKLRPAKDGDLFHPDPQERLF